MERRSLLSKMGRLISKPCPKCGGNLYMDKDYHGWYEQCLQCGLMHDLELIYEEKKKAKTDNP
jgi:hypothetical protein